jgi:GNAT superfamily N-acetyltransferase
MTQLPTLTLPGLQTDPRSVAITFPIPSGLPVTFRLLEASDAPILGDYFVGLSEDTKRRYGPHPFDQVTADQLCAGINYADTMRWVVTLPVGGTEQVIAYFLLVPGTGQSEQQRYAALGIPLDSAQDCTLAPSVADAYQNTGLGSRLMPHLKGVARGLGFRRMVLMGGVFVYNERAVHFYEKHGFRKVGGFEHTSGMPSYDMIMEL